MKFDCNLLNECLTAAVAVAALASPPDAFPPSGG